MNFYLSNGKPIPDLKSYIRNYIDLNPEVEIYIGTDSQKRRRRMVNYVTSICFRHPGNGVHVIYYKKLEKLPKDLYTKLWREVEFTISVVKLLNELSFNLIDGIEEGEDFIDKCRITVDLDINGLKKHGSNIAFESTKGYISSLGYVVRTKPEGFAASRASDHLCRR